MKFPAKSISNIDISEYYSVRFRSIWNGFKLESPAFKWLCVYFFFEYIRPQATYPIIDILPWGQLALLATCITAISDKSTRWVRNPGNLLLILYFFVVLLSAIFAFKPALAFNKFDIIVNWLLLYYLVITIVNTEKRFIIFLLFFFLLNFRMSQFGFRSFLFIGYSSYGVSGTPGWFQNSADLGVEMTIFVALSTGFVLALREYWGRYKRIFFYLLPITGMATVIATASRGALVGVFLAIAWFLIKSKLGVKALAAATVVGALIYLLLPQEMFQEFEGAGEDRTSTMRFALWGFGMDVVREYPFLGVGYHNWVDYCWYANPNGVENSGFCSVQHNSMVQAVSETGIVGFVLYISIIIFIFLANARARANAILINNKFIFYIAHGLDGGVIGYLGSSFFVSVLFYPMIWVQLAMTVALYEISKNQAYGNKVKLKNKLQQNKFGRVGE